MVRRPGLGALVGVLVATAGLVLPVDAGASTARGPVVVPTTQVAAPRTGLPVSMAVVGDSISQGTGSNGPGAPGGSIGSPRPAASWATGDQPGLDSYLQRLSATSGAQVRAVNLSANGATMRDDFVDQVRRVPAGTDLVLVQMGGNDLCRSSESHMTSVDEFRARVREGLAWLVEHRPDTLVMVSSIPDIYSLWYVRGAPHRGEQYPMVGFFVKGRDGPRAPRSFEENNNKRAARILWDTVGVVPCKTMLFRPNVPRNEGPTPDPTNTAEQRRLRVRDRNIEFNRALAEECASIIRCRFDDHAVFDLVSNRDARGVLLADTSQWRFVDADISTQDHFHPSFAGQRKLAAAVWSAGFDWSDRSAPVVTVSVDPPPVEGWHRSTVRLAVRARDDARVRGIEYRANGGAWAAVLGDGLELRIDHAGETQLDVRAVDRNGNVSAVERVVVRIDRSRPIVTIEPVLDGTEVLVGQRLVHRFRCADAGSGVASCSSSVPDGTALDTTTPGWHAVTVTATDTAGNPTGISQHYRVRYGWSGILGSAGGADAVEVHRGRPAPIDFVLSDHAGRPVPSASVEVSAAGPRGERWYASTETGTVRWSEALQRFRLVLDTSRLAPGPWTLTVRPDDGGAHPVDVVVTS